MNNLTRHLRGILFLLAALSNLTISANPGTVLSWGQLELPFPITNAIAISVKNAVAPGPNAVALRADGTVVTWGNGSHGLASPPDDLTDAVAVAAGGAHIVALRRDGTVREDHRPDQR